MRLLNERTMFKILVDGKGAMFSVTTKRRAYFFFLSGEFVGAKVAPTTDPSPGIVEVCGYDIPAILRNWDRLYRIKLSTLQDGGTGQTKRTE
jgi:hypothetical protein